MRFPSQSPKQPVSLRERPHNRRLVVAGASPTLKEDARNPEPAVRRIAEADVFGTLHWATIRAEPSLTVQRFYPAVLRCPLPIFPRYLPDDVLSRDPPLSSLFHVPDGTRPLGLFLRPDAVWSSRVVSPKIFVWFVQQKKYVSADTA
jgi:hypothetical protein